MIELDNIDKIENQLIEKFKSHRVFQNIESISLEVFIQILIQRRFLSLTFTPFYDMIIDALSEDIPVRITARRILREEYPDSSGNTPSHREDLLYDLTALGATKLDILKSYPTHTTNRAIVETLALIRSAAINELRDIKLLTILRFWGEVLISIEYSEFWKRMSKQLSVSGDKQSHFYYPHYSHDAKKETLKSASSLSLTHSDKLGMSLKKMLNSEEAKDSFIQVERKILRIKLKFYNQFSWLKS